MIRKLLKDIKTPLCSWNLPQTVDVWVNGQDLATNDCNFRLINRSDEIERKRLTVCFIYLIMHLF